jgi:conjugal transfer pilus assembly protein TraV
MRNKIHNSKILLICNSLLLFTLLSGCAAMNSSFDCPKGSGVMCKSLSEVNAMVDGGQVGQSYNNKETRNTINANTLRPTLSFVDRQFEPSRQNDTVMRVWLAPYQDGDDNYHPQSFVYAAVKKGQWVIQTPEKEASTKSTKANNSKNDTQSLW